MTSSNRYYDLNSYLRQKFGCRVQKITIDAGLSCPNRDGTLSSGGCIYCNLLGSGSGAHRRGQSITDQLLAGKAAMKKRYGAQKFIAYFQSFTNTYAPLDRLAAMYAEALAVEDVVGLSIGTRPDCVGPEVLDLLAACARVSLVWVEYGLQSAHDETLARINRGHNFAAFEKAVRATRNRGIRICAHIILGLPGETREMMLQTARLLAVMGIDGIKLHLLYVAKGTGLADLYEKGEYRCLTQAEYVDLVCEFLSLLPPETVIQRLTSDPQKNELIAPEWSLAKGETLRLIQKTMEERNLRQGGRKK